jgi:hypothetical protein
VGCSNYIVSIRQSLSLHYRTTKNLPTIVCSVLLFTSTLHVNGNFLLKYLPASCSGAVCCRMDTKILLINLSTSVTITG